MKARSTIRLQQTKAGCQLQPRLAPWNDGEERARNDSTRSELTSCQKGEADLAKERGKLQTDNRKWLLTVDSGTNSPVRLWSVWSSVYRFLRSCDCGARGTREEIKFSICCGIWLTTGEKNQRACLCFFMHCKQRFIKERGESSESERNAEVAFFFFLKKHFQCCENFVLIRLC